MTLSGYHFGLALMVSPPLLVLVTPGAAFSVLQLDDRWGLGGLWLQIVEVLQECGLISWSVFSTVQYDLLFFAGYIIEDQ